MTTIAEKLQTVRSRIEQAAVAAGRRPDEVLLVAVSKTFGVEAVEEAIAAGQRHFGENYIQEALEKMAALAPQRAALGLVWHCIGPVQSNKTRAVAEHFDWVHTVDRLKIAERLSAQRPEHLPPLQVCLQVNSDGGPNKSGVAPQDVPELARAVAVLPRLCLRGLMHIPEPAPDAQAARLQHQRLTLLFQHMAGAALDGNAQWDTLSMGMSADLDAAVQAGSTHVRIGTAIFGGRAAAGH